MKSIIIKSAFFFFCIFLQGQTIAQNIGINTPDPSAKLHIDGAVALIKPIDIDFENNSLLPATNQGEEDWYVTGTDGYNSTYSAKCPLIFNAGNKAILNYNYQQPLDKHVHVQFFYKYIDPNDKVDLGFTINGTDHFPPETPNSWKTFSTTFIGNGSADIMKFTVVATQAEANPTIVIDDIIISHDDGHAFKLTDGNQGSGYILETDDLGHASWVDLRTEIDANILSAAQDLHFNTSNYDLSIDDGNMVAVSGLKTYNGEKFGIEGFTLEGSPGFSIDLPNANSTTSRFYYNSTSGEFIRGRYSFVPTPGSFATSWGKDNMANGDYSTAFGEGNIAQGQKSIAWGKDNESLTSYSTTWGLGNYTNSYLSTTWGEGNETHQSHATTFGKNNINNGTHSLVWGLNNVVDGSYSAISGKDNLCHEDYNFIGGRDNVTSAYYNFIFGEGCQALNEFETAFGKYNSTVNVHQLFSIGNGTDSNNRSNVLKILDWGYLDLVGQTNAQLEVKAVSNNAKFNIISGNDATMTMSAPKTAELLITGQDISRISLGSPSNNKSIYYFPSTSLVNAFNEIYIKNGNVGIGEINPSYDLEIGNNSAAKPGSSSWTVSSDARLKKDVHPFTDGLSILSAIDPVWFTYNGLAGIPQSTHVGTIAQELEKVAPYMVGSFIKEEDGTSTEYKDVNYGAMDFILINSVKEQQKLIDRQNVLIDSLKAQLNIQETRLNQQQTQINDIMESMVKN